MFEIITEEATTVELKELVNKLVLEVIGRKIETATKNIYPLQNVFIRKVKIIKSPKLDYQKLMELHGGAADEVGSKIDRSGFKEPKVQESV
jgi:small subunit ribosomal protein S3Ae